MKNLPEMVTCLDGKSRPTRFNDRRFIADSEIKIIEFWDWFSESNMIDENGFPLAFYHSTPSLDGSMPFESFDSSKSKWNGLLFFTADYNWARDFGSEKADIAETNEYTFTVALKLTNTFDYLNADHVDTVCAQLPEDIPIYNYYAGDMGHTISKIELKDYLLSSKHTWLVSESPIFIEAIIKSGFDSMISREGSCTTLSITDGSKAFVLESTKNIAHSIETNTEIRETPLEISYAQPYL